MAFYISLQRHTVYALDARSGWAVWRFRTNKAVISSPAVDKGTVFVGSVDNSVYALDKGTGRQVWKFSTDNQVTSSPAVFENGVYFGSWTATSTVWTHARRTPLALPQPVARSHHRPSLQTE